MDNSNTAENIAERIIAEVNKHIDESKNWFKPDVLKKTEIFPDVRINHTEHVKHTIYFTDFTHPEIYSDIVKYFNDTVEKFDFNETVIYGMSDMSYIIELYPKEYVPKDVSILMICGIQCNGLLGTLFNINKHDPRYIKNIVKICYYHNYWEFIYEELNLYIPLCKSRETTVLISIRDYNNIKFAKPRNNNNINNISASRIDNTYFDKGLVTKLEIIDGIVNPMDYFNSFVRSNGGKDFIILNHPESNISKPKPKPKPEPEPKPEIPSPQYQPEIVKHQKFITIQNKNIARILDNPLEKTKTDMLFMTMDRAEKFIENLRHVIAKDTLTVEDLIKYENDDPIVKVRIFDEVNNLLKQKTIPEEYRNLEGFVAYDSIRDPENGTGYSLIMNSVVFRHLTKKGYKYPNITKILAAEISKENETLKKLNAEAKILQLKKEGITAFLWKEHKIINPMAIPVILDNPDIETLQGIRSLCFDIIRNYSTEIKNKASKIHDINYDEVEKISKEVNNNLWNDPQKFCNVSILISETHTLLEFILCIHAELFKDVKVKYSLGEHKGDFLIHSIIYIYTSLIELEHVLEVADLFKKNTSINLEKIKNVYNKYSPLMDALYVILDKMLIIKPDGIFTYKSYTPRTSILKYHGNGGKYDKYTLDQIRQIFEDSKGSSELISEKLFFPKGIKKGVKRVVRYSGPCLFKLSGIYNIENGDNQTELFRESQSLDSYLNTVKVEFSPILKNINDIKLNTTMQIETAKSITLIKAEDLVRIINSTIEDENAEKLAAQKAKEEAEQKAKEAAIQKAKREEEMKLKKQQRKEEADQKAEETKLIREMQREEQRVRNLVKLEKANQRKLEKQVENLKKQELKESERIRKLCDYYANLKNDRISHIAGLKTNISRLESLIIEAKTKLHSKYAELETNRNVNIIEEIDQIEKTIKAHEENLRVEMKDLEIMEQQLPWNKKELSEDFNLLLSDLGTYEPHTLYETADKITFEGMLYAELQYSPGCVMIIPEKRVVQKLFVPSYCISVNSIYVMIGRYIIHHDFPHLSISFDKLEKELRNYQDNFAKKSKKLINILCYNINQNELKTRLSDFKNSVDKDAKLKELTTVQVHKQIVIVEDSKKSKKSKEPETPIIPELNVYECRKVLKPKFMLNEKTKNTLCAENMPSKTFNSLLNVFAQPLENLSFLNFNNFEDSMSKNLPRIELEDIASKVLGQSSKKPIPKHIEEIVVEKQVEEPLKFSPIVPDPEYRPYDDLVLIFNEKPYLPSKLSIL